MENLWSACKLILLVQMMTKMGVWLLVQSGSTNTLENIANDCMIGALAYYLHFIPFRACRSSTLQASPSLCSGHVLCKDHVLLDNHSFRSPPVSIYLSYLN